MLGPRRRLQHCEPHARDFLLRIFESLDAEDRTFATKHLLDDRAEPEHNLPGFFSRTSPRDFSVEAFELGRTMRELPLRHKAREYLIWAAGFGLAEEAIHTCYSDLREDTRWAANPRVTDTYPTDPVEDRRVLERLSTTLTCHIDLLEGMPHYSPDLTALPRLTRCLMPVSHLAAPRGLSNLVYQAVFHAFVTFVKYLKGENEPYAGCTRAQANIFYGGLVLSLVAGSSVVGYLVNMGGCVDLEIKKRMAAAADAIIAFDRGAREYVSAWKALRAVVRTLLDAGSLPDAGALLDADSLSAEQERQIRVFLRAFDARYARPRRQSLTVLQAVHEKIILEDDRDALLAEIESRYLAEIDARYLAEIDARFLAEIDARYLAGIDTRFLAPAAVVAAAIPTSPDEEEEDDPLRVRPYGYVSRALKDIMARACDELGLTESLWRQQEPLRKNSEPLRKHNERLRKRQEPLHKHQEPLRKRQEPLRKHIEPLQTHQESRILHRDPLLKHRILCKSATWPTARRDYFVAMSLLVDALARLEAGWPFLEPFLRNVHARLAWAGGVAHGLHSINAHVASWNDTLEPEEEDLRRFIRTLDHYIIPLTKSCARLVHPANLNTIPLRTKLWLVARETARSIAYPLLFTPYALTPRVNNWYARQAAYVLYARLLDCCVDNQSQNAIAGMFDYFFDYPDVVEIRRIKETVAQVEHTSDQLLVAWMTMRHAAQRTLETKHPGLLLDSLDLYSSSDIKSHSQFSCLGCSLPSLLKRLGPERADAIFEEVVELSPRLPGENRQMSSGQKRARAGFEGTDETVGIWNEDGGSDPERPVRRRRV